MPPVSQQTRPAHPHPDTLCVSLTRISSLNAWTKAGHLISCLPLSTHLPRTGKQPGTIVPSSCGRSHLTGLSYLLDPQQNPGGRERAERVLEQAGGGVQLERWAGPDRHQVRVACGRASTVRSAGRGRSTRPHGLCICALVELPAKRRGMAAPPVPGAHQQRWWLRTPPAGWKSFRPAPRRW